VGQVIDVNGVPLTVIGVLNSVGDTSSTTGSNQDDQVIVPLSTATERIFGSTSLSSILIEANSGSSLSAAYQEADAELLALHDIATPSDADFTISSEASLVSTSTSVDRTLTILLSGIAAISLLVGGIGVMNIMLVSVTERIREIGLRKALGAKPSLIRRQFLLEACVLGLTGGALGVALAALGTDLLPKAIGYPIALSGSATVGAIAVAVAIGLIFGVYPASRAARMAPIDALRSE
jgi:putative ABC transport system permease protein